MVFLLAWVVRADKVFNVRAFGAVANNKADCSKAFLNAWKEACAWNGISTVLVPKGTYLVGKPTEFIGPCKGFMNFRLEGVLKAPTSLSGFADTWLKFGYLDGLMVNGGGTLDGQGRSAWQPCTPKCKILPANLRFDFVKNAKVEQIHSVDSKNIHINLYGCQNMNLSSLTIVAPGDSINTDGIHTGDSTFIYIEHSKIGTGDDCISFSTGSKNIYVTDIICGPGHGISIGSLGATHDEDSVTGLIIKDSTFFGTDNGVRIKTWASSVDNFVQNITFLHLSMNNVRNPIIIDQEYCPAKNCDNKSPSRVQIKDGPLLPRLR
ncbi:Exopolygalacturonase [Thalictrum thalictroides]|uniref:Exopolygalacturonase n=1 Tax=Thalictrum thalictroides TaxID=46969 RepID=A0A7J6WFE6_THATH|nr:Exopolygalacturonase [Thalictrum thalictroides]